jgi:hypothetical protein
MFEGSTKILLNIFIEFFILLALIELNPGSFDNGQNPDLTSIPFLLRLSPIWQTLEKDKFLNFILFNQKTELFDLIIF